MNTNLSINDLYPSKYIKSADIGETDMILTINRVEFEDFGFGESKETKPVLYFDETDKGLVLNVTNANTIASLYGDKIDNWTGKRIALFPTEVSFQGRQVMGTRVRMSPPE